MNLRWGYLAAIAAAAAIVPSLVLGQASVPPKPPPARPAGAPPPERVVVAEVREARCRDGSRSVSVKMPDAGEQPAEVRIVDSQGLVSTYVLIPQPKRPLSADQACTLRVERGYVVPWY